MTTPSFPECVYLGGFHSPQLGGIAACLPAAQGGFCLHFAPEHEQQALRLAENAALALLADSPAALLHLHIIDFSNRPRFPYLNQLVKQQLCRTLLNGQAALQAFNELEQILQHRYHTLFQNGENFWQYNARSRRAEACHVLIVNTACFPEYNSPSPQRLQDFLRNAGDAGVYIIALHNQATPAEPQNPSRESLLAALPAIRLNAQGIHTDDVLPAATLYRAGFAFTPLDVNQDQILNTLRQNLAPQSADEQDFLRIKIGSFADGSDAYFSLGNACGSHHALLLGGTGSGKSSLLKNLIIRIGEQHHAQQFRLYLMDYKNGVEFNAFRNHPNVEKIFFSREDNVRAGMDFLKQVQAQIEQRNTLFRDAAVQNLNDYNAKYPDTPLPRILLIIDEFHILLRGDFRHQQYANTLLEDIAKLGRSAGVHLLFSTQSLRNVNLDAATRDQIGLRISYRVADEGALGYELFRNAKDIVSLPPYHACFQSGGRSDSVQIDPPQDAEAAIRRIRAARPAHLQVQAEIIDALEAADVPPVADAERPAEAAAPKANPIKQNFDEFDKIWQQPPAPAETAKPDDDDEILNPKWINEE
ncbi:FtsK/SpoIIIE domain-containing protein [Conchiformibius kuhniae]|uniref:FtsK/SpoIIIE domain-containing protein n=1 Tax=Conchiformibius kuhniae TaxID=211502 RepID=A0A8T9MY07_9NEIS|nr:FtsK/SpoIIIE domain-containing protein [Conchiformibius kuhniae]UOP05306.1 hypothetical protein LVJ77_03640 [Conchiformibius kuhniae]